MVSREIGLNALLIAGTGSGVGKTLAVTALAAYFQRYHKQLSLGVFKPIDRGGRDRQFYANFLKLDQSPEEISPVCFESSLVPPIAAEQMGEKIRLETIWKRFEALTQQYDWVLMEGTDSLATPFNRETTLADLAWDWRLPTVLVVPVQADTVAQAVAYSALACQCKAYLKGIVLNCVEPRSPEEVEQFAPANLLQSLTQKPVLGCIPHLSDPTDLEKLVHVASALDLERLLPPL